MSAQRIRDIARDIARGEASLAEQRLGSLLGELGDHRDPAAVGHYVFAAALAERLSGHAAAQANLYLNRFDVPQIHLFNLLAREVPLVGLTTIIANRCIAREVAGQKHATIIDVGIGTGRQVTELLALLGQSGELPNKLTVIGIEPSDWSLDLAGQNVRAVAENLSVALEFHGFCSVAEGLTRTEWGQISKLCETRPVVNASFALHHVSDVDGSDVRDDVLLRLRSLDPLALVLSEPNSDHLQPDFEQRFDNCWRHFGSVFALIDELGIRQEDKDALKVCFFGREVKDIVASAENKRSERHESTASWLERLRKTGYVAAIDVELPSAPPVEPIARGDHVTLDYDGEAMVAVLRATPAPGNWDVSGALSRAPSHSMRQRITLPIDVPFYLGALAAVARADAVLHQHEQSYIAEQARIFGTADAVWQESTLEELLTRAEAVSPLTREAVVRDLVFLARLDDHYHAEERRTIAAVAKRLGISEDDLRRIEQQDLLPPVLAGGPSWFRELWFLGAK